MAIFCYIIFFIQCASDLLCGGGRKWEGKPELFGVLQEGYHPKRECGWLTAAGKASRQSRQNQKEESRCRRQKRHNGLFVPSRCWLLEQRCWIGLWNSADNQSFVLETGTATCAELQITVIHLVTSAEEAGSRRPFNSFLPPPVLDPRVPPTTSSVSPYGDMVAWYKRIPTVLALPTFWRRLSSPKGRREHCVYYKKLPKMAVFLFNLHYIFYYLLSYWHLFYFV